MPSGRAREREQTRVEPDETGPYQIVPYQAQSYSVWRHSGEGNALVQIGPDRHLLADDALL